eukprot:4102024-Heterocapsa_arctica.AAC.1
MWKVETAITHGRASLAIVVGHPPIALPPVLLPSLAIQGPTVGPGLRTIHWGLALRHPFLGYVLIPP